MYSIREIEIEEIENIPDSVWEHLEHKITADISASPELLARPIAPVKHSEGVLAPFDGMHYFMVLLFFLLLTTISLTIYPILFPNHSAPVSGAIYVAGSVVASGIISLIILLAWKHGAK